MMQQEILVFIEVRYRQHNRYHDALSSVTPQKIKKIIKTAEFYILKKRLEDIAVRFDVIAIDGKLTKKNVKWVQQAFL